jgi:ATP-dependent Clp protease ATP-binding subunit ClpA
VSAAREQVAEFFGYEAPEYLELGWRRLPLSRRARAALEQAMREVVRRADRRLDAEHVLLALLRDEHAGAVRTLAGLGTSTETVQRVLEAALERRDGAAKSSSTPRATTETRKQTMEPDPRHHAPSGAPAASGNGQSSSWRSIERRSSTSVPARSTSASITARNRSASSCSRASSSG